MFAPKLRCLNCDHVFYHVRFLHEKDETVRCPACTLSTVGTELYMWVNHVLSYGSELELHDVSIIGFSTAIKAEGRVAIRGSNLLLKDNHVGIDAEDLYLDVEGLDIE